MREVGQMSRCVEGLDRLCDGQIEVGLIAAGICMVRQNVIGKDGQGWTDSLRQGFDRGSTTVQRSYVL